MHPVVFQLPTPWGEVPIFSYGMMLGSSLVVAWLIIMVLGEKRGGMSRDVMASCFLVTAAFALVSSRVLYVLTNLEHFDGPASWFDIQSGGYVAYGGFLGGLLGSWLYLRHKKLSLLAWADVTAPTLALGLALTRIGCYLYGCDFGAPLEEDAPSWLRDLGTFPHHAGGGSPAFEHHVGEYGLSPLAHYSLPVHPTQLYESVFGLALFGGTLLLWQRRKFRGQIILAVTVLYGVWRFLIEYVRDDPERGFYFGFSTSQLISMALVPVAGFLYFELRRRQGDAPLVVEPVVDAEDARPAPAPAPAPRAGKPRKKKRKAP